MKRKGEITVEAALVMPVILASIFLLYSLAMIQYGNVVTRTEAMRVANRVAMSWNTIGGDKNNILTEDLKPVSYKGEEQKAENKTGKHAISSETFEEHDPYRFFLELFTEGSQKGKNVSNYLEKRMNQLSDQEVVLDFESEDEISSDKGYHLFNRYVNVTIKNTYNNPIIGLLKEMGYEQKRTYNVTMKAKLTEPADFVRNVSYIEEIMRNLKGSKKEGD
ncbi:MAG: hypothetical protein PUC30_03765 [Lachnospiraceae bacterium]|nr:hypothetical protein [Lachnospiraceae bacterium]